MRLEPVLPNAAQDALRGMPEGARAVVEVFRRGYADHGYCPPWIGYTAVEGNGVVGLCAFKTAPRDGRVEIAYFTLPEKVGQGVATRMAQALIALAREHQPGATIAAQTLPEEGPSTAVLAKLGFARVGDVRHEEDGLVWEWQLPT